MGYFAKKESQLKVDMILNRALKYAIVAPNLKNQNATPEQVFPLPWENQNNNVLDLEVQKLEIEKSKKRWAQLDRKRKKLKK